MCYLCNCFIVCNIYSVWNLTSSIYWEMNYICENQILLAINPSLCKGAPCGPLHCGSDDSACRPDKLITADLFPQGGGHYNLISAKLIKFNIMMAIATYKDIFVGDLRMSRCQQQQKWDKKHYTWSFPMDPLPDMKNCDLRMCRECQEQFPCHRGLVIPEGILKLNILRLQYV